MDNRTQTQLIQLNRNFYAQVAQAFDDTRQDPWEGWELILPEILALASPVNVLDVGCGNGRFGVFLAQQRLNMTYSGLDSEPRLLSAAKKLLPQQTWLWADITSEGWEQQLAPPYALVVMFGVLHHMPGIALRERLLQTASELVGTRGLLVVSFWQFGKFERFAKKRVSWEEYNRVTGEEIDVGELEPGDYLLRFQDKDALRYCHSFEDGEISSLVDATRMSLVKTFTADGKEGYNRYVVLERS